MIKLLKRILWTFKIASRLKRKLQKSFLLTVGRLDLSAMTWLASMRTLVPFLKIRSAQDLSLFLYESYVISVTKGKKSLWWKNLYSGQKWSTEQASSLEQVMAQLARPAKKSFRTRTCMPSFPQSFGARVWGNGSLTRDYIRKGYVQCVLSQRFQWFSGKPLDYYRNLRGVTSPSNYLYFYDFGSTKLSVPVRRSGVSQDQWWQLIPLRASEDDEEADRRWQLIWQGIKEVAEHRMLVDLGRNDISHVISKWVQLKWPNIWSGILPLCHAPDQCGGINYFWTSLHWGWALFQDISGAPKIRELWSESIKGRKEKRGVYARLWLSLWQGILILLLRFEPWSSKIRACIAGWSRVFMIRSLKMNTKSRQWGKINRIGEGRMIFIEVDNYDSFTYRFSAVYRKIWWVQVLRSDQFVPSCPRNRCFGLFSRWVGQRMRRMEEMIEISRGQTILGICLEHQAIGRLGTLGHA